jgi:DNA-binding response OmpR family regulator
MSERPFTVLIFDRDPDVLITLQRVLEDAGLDTTITWDEAETRNLVATMRFDVILLRDCPPGLIAENIRHDLRNKHSCPCMVLIANKGEAEHFLRLGFMVIDKRVPFRVLEQVQRYTHSEAA